MSPLAFLAASESHPPGRCNGCALPIATCEREARSSPLESPDGTIGLGDGFAPAQPAHSASTAIAPALVKRKVSTWLLLLYSHNGLEGSNATPLGPSTPSVMVSTSVPLG